MTERKSFKGKAKKESFQKKSSLKNAASGNGSNYRFLNPYNFVRFLGKGKDKPDDIGVSLLGHYTPPPHDRYVAINGKITCAVKNVTPLFISDSEGTCEDPSGHKTYRFFQVNNQYVVPASTLRGMVRSVFEAVTNSCMAVFEGARQSYRLNPKLAPYLVPVRVEKDGNNWRLRLLTGTTSLSIGAMPKGPQYSAWIHRYWPIKPSGTLLQDPPQNSRVRQFQQRTDRLNGVDLHDVQHGQECYALLTLMKHPHPNIQFWDVGELDTNQNRLERMKKADQRVEKGWMCITNQNIEPKHSERFFFRASENMNHPETIELPEDIRRQYEDLIRDYQKRHQNTVRERIQHDQPFHAPVGEEPGLSRFIYMESEQKLQGGELAYAMLEGPVKHPQVKFMVPVSVPRVVYEKNITDLLMRHHDHLKPCNDYEQLCPACRVFGWAHQQAPDDPTVRVAYAGRVAFSHAVLQDEPKKINKPISLAILSSPKPTTTEFYLLSVDEQPKFNVDYNADDTQLRGRKFYRHHGKNNLERTYENGKHEYERIDGKRDRHNRTVVDALDEDNRFTFTLYFENLAPVELGALLWALELEDGWVHRLGFAKPLGFGSVQIKVDKFEALNPCERYESLEKRGWHEVSRETWQQKCIEPFKKAMETCYGSSFEKLKNVKDMRALLGVIPTKPVHYPRPPYHDTSMPDPEGKQYEWFIGNEEEVHLSPEIAEQDIKGLPLIDKDGHIL